MKIMHTMASEASAGRPKRRFYSPELKTQVVAECQAQGASVAGVALAHGINANIVHRWLRERACQLQAVTPQEFLPLTLEAAAAPAKAERDVAAAPARLRAQAARHQPAGEMAVVMMREAGAWERMRALELEAAAFGAVTQTQATKSMVQTFLNDQAVKKLARQQGEGARNVRQAAVIGAGIMGGGIAYTSALRGIPVRMKDISPAALEAGMGEVRRQLARQMHQGKLTQSRADAVLASITPQIDDRAMDGAELVIEAVVENLSVKHKVLAELEQSIFQDAVLASNTSSLRINDIAAHLARPQNVVGLHFFNPVPVMPLVEVVRGSRSSASAVATATAYVSSLGKTPIVVKDCPRLPGQPHPHALHHRLLQPGRGRRGLRAHRPGDGSFRLAHGARLLEGRGRHGHLQSRDRRDLCRVSPAHAAAATQCDPGARARGRVGQKSGRGFYDYDAAEGKPRKSPSRAAKALMTAVQRGAARGAIWTTAIVERMMLPMLLEAIRTLEEGVVATAAELDMAMLLGVGFPAYLGGPLKYADWLGAPLLLKRCEALAAHGPACEAPAMLRDMAATGQSFYRD